MFITKRGKKNSAVVMSVDIPMEDLKHGIEEASFEPVVPPQSSGKYIVDESVITGKVMILLVPPDTAHRRFMFSFSSSRD